MELVSALLRVGWVGDSPLLVFLGTFFEIFVDGVKLVERNFLLEFIEVEHPDFDDPFCTFVGSVGSLVLSFFVNGVEFTHFEEHVVLLVNFVLFDAVVKLLLSIELFFFVFSQVVLGVVFD